MPLSTANITTYGPGGVLTGKMIAAEASRLWRRRLKQRGVTFLHNTIGHGDLQAGDMQVYVDWSHSVQDLTLSLQEFSTRYLKPASTALADAPPVSAIVNATLRLIHDIQRDQFIARLDTIYRT